MNRYFYNMARANDAIVPQNKEQYFEYYVVESGDTLYGIARRNNINPELLASMNGIEINDYIYPNQELLIPKKNYSYYITTEGDTLNTVADTFKTNLNNLLQSNSTIYLLPNQLIVSRKRNDLN